MNVRAELETDRARAVRRVIWITLVLNLGVAVAKIGYGVCKRRMSAMATAGGINKTTRGS